MITKEYGPVMLYNSNNGPWAFRTLRFGRLKFSAHRSYKLYHFSIEF